MCECVPGRPAHAKPTPSEDSGGARGRSADNCGSTGERPGEPGSQSAKRTTSPFEESPSFSARLSRTSSSANLIFLLEEHAADEFSLNGLGLLHLNIVLI